MADQKCKSCDHPRRQHDNFRGCQHRGETPAENCMCPVKYTERGMFE